VTPIDAYMIAYLVHHGWEYQAFGDVWTRAGRLHSPTDCLGREIETDEFDLEDAYDCELGYAP